MHLAKPFTRESFFEMLRKFLRDDETAPLPSDAVVSAKLSDDAEMNQLLVDFIDSLPVRVEDLVTACDGEDWATMEARAHKLRGSAGLYGFPELGSLAERIEALAKKRDSGVRAVASQAAELCHRIVAGRHRTASFAPLPQYA
jgi:HPt (histidine-containing phosphotransfer) domain-containing protein